MAFSIRFEDVESDSGESIGRLELGDFNERFLADMYLWSADDYRKQWREALLMVVDGMQKSALVTNFVEPPEAVCLVWWPLYLEGENVFVQNQLLIFEQLNESFDPSKLYTYVRHRSTVNEDGEKISEWRIALSDIEAFVRSERWT